MTGNRLSLAALTLSAAFAIGCPSGGGDSGGNETAAAGGSSAAAERGKQHFATVCATCHGQSGEGVQGLGKTLQASEWLKNHSDEEFAKLILEGRPADHPENTTKVAMPPKGGSPGLTETDVADIVAYVRTLQK